MTILDAAERFASLDRSQVLLNAARCLHSQDQFSECTACFELCPVQAITEGKPPALSAEICQSCLACIPACPLGAYQADDDVSSLLNCAAHVEGKSVELLCGLHPHPETGVEEAATGIQLRGCLAALGSAAYLSLSALGMERISLRVDACFECKWASLRGQIDRQAAEAAIFLDAWDRAGAMVTVEQVDTPVKRPFWNAKNPPLSRRDLFRMLGRQGQMAMARAMENEQAAHEKQPGRQRRRLLGAMGHLPPRTRQPESRLEGFALLKVTEACNACGTCEKGCPTHALEFLKDEKEMTFRLSFSPQACIGCELCAHVCGPAAITVDPAPSFGEVFGPEEPVLLQSGKLARCSHCRSWMAERPGKKLCDLCEFRRAHPFGSTMPPGLQARKARPGNESPS